MSKIMLVLDNQDDQNFLEKILGKLKYTVISMTRGQDLSEQLIDHFPDVVFASTLGRNEKILNALGKIKQVRGKPKLVFVKQEMETSVLSPEQKRIIDGTLNTPIDPFKLIEILVKTTDFDANVLRERYNEALAFDRGKAMPEVGDEDAFDSVDLKKTPEAAKSEYGATRVMGKKRPQQGVEVELEPDAKPAEVDALGGDTNTSQSTTPNVMESSAPQASRQQSLIHDSDRKKKYEEWTQRMKAEGPPPQPTDMQKVRSLQAQQAKEIQESPKTKEERKHFLKTLFSISPDQVTKKD